MSDYPNYATADDLCRKEKELQTVTFVKVIMMLLVVLGHVTAVYTGAGWGGITPLNDNRILALLSNWVGTFHTQTFTFASGYLFYMLRYEKGGYRNPGKDITRRVKQLCIPYITAALLWVIPSHWLVFGFKNDELIPFLLLGKAPGQLWFLIMLFGVFLIFYCFSDIIMKIKPALCIVVLLVVSIFGSVAGHFSMIFTVFRFSTILQYMIYFYLGFLVRKRSYKYWKKLNTVLFSVAHITLFVILQLTAEQVGYIQYLRICIVPLCSILAIYTAMGISYNFTSKKSVEGTLFKLLSGTSMGIYLLHQQILYLTLRITNFEWIPSLIWSLINFVLAILISHLLTMIISKFKVGRFLIGLDR